MENMENMENMEAEDIYYVEITNNKRFNGVYVNKKVILENEIVDEEMASIKREVEPLMFEIKKLNIDTELKKYLFKRDFEMYRLKNELRDMKSDFKMLKRDLLGTEDNNIDEAIDED